VSRSALKAGIRSKVPARGFLGESIAPGSNLVDLQDLGAVLVIDLEIVGLGSRTAAAGLMSFVVREWNSHVET